MRYVLCVCAICALPAVSVGDLIDGNIDSMTDADQWTADSLSVGQFYGPGYALNGSGQAMLDDYAARNNWGSRNAARRALLTAVPVPEAGSYSWNLETALTNYHNQYNYWQTYLVKEGSTIDLVGGPAWNSRPSGTKLLAKGYAPASKDGGDFYEYALNFDISNGHINQGYDYVALVMVGSRHSNQMLGWGNVMTDMPTAVGLGGGNGVPEPATAAMLAVGAVIMSRRRLGLA